MPRTIHIIGAGLAGLSAAVRLTERGERVIVHEATPVAGGRCRSYHDLVLDMVIDNGNHLLLSGNHAALAFVRSLGAEHRLTGPAKPEFNFADHASGKKWTLAFNEGRLPWWIFDPRKRAPGTSAFDYLQLARLLWASPGKTVGEVIACRGPVYDRLVQPLLLAALNIDPPQGSAKLAAAVIGETLAAGGAACRPLIAHAGLGATMIEPALAFLQQRGIEVRFGHQLQKIHFGEHSVEALDFGAETLQCQAGDVALLAVPPYAAVALVPGLNAPNEFRAIVNAHFRIRPLNSQPPILGVLNAASEWIFAFPERISTTTSAGDRLLDTPRETLAQTIWAEVSALTGLPAALPPWQIVRERRATFAATPAQDARRPDAQTGWNNLFLAGDWTNTGLPATIEGAIRSGNCAADLVGQH